ncbi:hypothetical protein CLUG_02201 [Clavispora lusitaniae ATCC 42720]|uniref:Uncharacterized protein n=1 Tax=Clavispora lusitaniae (strain ATCC 42720) TaxID=306902 RepID=C4Y1W9_CLAL4|nr:uncharacterized protein CLUG_02201 [Clavispora lusitaniae ATCC 42720]EEQ38079.1 hypothetical protein CLUG_02201 [Clavispora lusitaniae ATCC 42720]
MHDQSNYTTLFTSCRTLKLLFLDSAGTSNLSRVDRSLVGLDVAGGTLQCSQEAWSSLERSLQVARSRLSKQVDLDNVGLQSRLDGGHRSHHQWVGVLHVQVHEAHHGQGGENTLDLSVNSLQVVLLNSGDNSLRLSSARHWARRLNVLQRGQVVLLVDLHLDIHANAKHNKSARNVAHTDVKQDVWVLKVQAAGHLHHDQHEPQVSDGWIHFVWKKRCMRFFTFFASARFPPRYQRYRDRYPAQHLPPCSMKEPHQKFSNRENSFG